jgi:hypothetical protein
MTRMISVTLAIAFCVGRPLGPAAQVPGPSTPGAIAQPLRSDAQPPTAAQLRGRVFDAGNGKPLRRALVRIVSPELREVRASATDEQGRYEFTALRASRYHLVAEKDGYLSLEYGQTRPFGAGKPVELRGTETLEKVDFSLPRGAVITGLVVDEYGDPAPNLQVRALRYATVQGRKGLTDETSDTTDDLGEYRLSGLAPARYYVSAAVPHPVRADADADAPTDDEGGAEYGPTYYPGTPNVSEGRPVTLALGRPSATLTSGSCQRGRRGSAERRSIRRGGR